MSRQSSTFKQTAFLGIFFLLLVTTYNSFSHIVNYIAQTTDSLYPFQGELALIVNYFVYLVGLTRAPSIKDYKRQFLIAAVCYSLNYSLYLFQFDRLLGLLASILGAILGGFGASVLWVSQGGYLMKLFKKYQIEKDSEGYYMGIMNGLVYASALLGSVIITFGLGLFGNLVYFLILTSIGMLAFLMCWIFLDPLDQVQEQNDQQQQKCSHLWRNLLIVLKFFKNMKFLIVAMILDGFMLGFATSSFSDIVPQHIRSSLNVGIVLIVNGTGSIIGGYLSGTLSDKIAASQLGIIGFLYLIITFLITMLTDYMRVETLTFPIVIGLLWGIGLYFLEGWIFVCCAKIYQGKMETFAVVKQVHTLSFILFQVARIIFNSHINTSVFQIVLIALSIAAIYCCMRMQALEKTNKHDEMVQEDPSPPAPFD